jgi:ubiquinone/menaquinone biosynthesis C-methylase UbiE
MTAREATHPMATAQNTTVVHLTRSRSRAVGRTSVRTIADAYDHAGEQYVTYADGIESADAASNRDRFAHADDIVWKTIRGEIDALRRSGITCLRVLDAGCGPGTWLRRVAGYATSVGLELDAVGFDISTGLLDIAQRQTARSDIKGRWKISFIEHNLVHSLPWRDRHFHIVLSNYVVLNHLPKSVLPRAIDELCRVSSHRVIASVRALASPPTGCIIGTEQVREYHQDCERAELMVLLKDGTKHRLTFNMFSAENLREMFSLHATVIDLRAVDLFATRFAPDEHWTASAMKDLRGRSEVLRELKDVEEKLCRQPGWVDHGTHVLLVAEPNRQARA